MTTRKILEDNVVPESYSVLIDTREDEFYGSVSIKTNVRRATSQLRLNIQKLKIIDIEIKSDQGSITKDDIKHSEDDQVLTLGLEKEVSGVVYINVSYYGKITNSMNGYYVSQYKNGTKTERLYSTHFEPTSARRAVPSFDQPDMKATFDVILTVPEGMTGLSNMDMAYEGEISMFTKEVNPNNASNTKTKLNKMQLSILQSSINKSIVFFNTTPKMSTYLLAFVIGKIERLQTTLGDIKINVYAPSGEEEDGEYALKITKECLDYYQNYFKIKYPLPKLDNIAIPNFAMGAMENWGLITYRKSSLLYGKNSSLQTKKLIAETVCHELAHQWFGNLVTMKWWNDLWLNEGFATWASYKAIEKLENEFPATDFISSETSYGISYDALNSTHPISVEVNDPKEIDQIFDGISYSKGACLINMLEDYLGNDFEKGLVSYLKGNEYSNAETKDLWESLKVDQLMHDWVLREGVPIVSVEEKDDYLLLRQKRFLFVPDYKVEKLDSTKARYNDNDSSDQSSDSDDDDLDKKLNASKKSLSKSNNSIDNTWKIPIRISFYGEETELNELYMFEAKEMKINKKSDLYKLNNASAGFYITHYENDNLRRKLLESVKLGEKDKLNILNDTFNLIKGSMLPVKIGLELIPLYKNETNSDILASIISELSDIKSIFYKDDKQRMHLQEVIMNTINDKIDDAFKNIKGENLKYNELSLYTSIITAAVNNDHKTTIAELGNIFDKYKKDKSSIHPNFRGAMFVSLMKRYNNGENELFDELYDLYSQERSDDVKNGMLLALGASNNFDFLSEKLLEDTIKTQDKMYLFSSLANNIQTRDQIIEFTIRNFKKIQSMFEDNSSLLGFVVERVFGIVSHQDKREEVIDFFRSVDFGEIDRSVRKCLEKSEIRIRFRNANLSSFE